MGAAVAFALVAIAAPSVLDRYRSPDIGRSEYANVYSLVDPGKEFTFKLGFDPNTVLVDGEPALSEDIAQVFVDPQLTIPAPDAMVRTIWDNEVVISPMSDPSRS